MYVSFQPTVKDGRFRIGVNHLVLRVCHKGGHNLREQKRRLISSPVEDAGKHSSEPAEDSWLVCHSAKDHLKSRSHVSLGPLSSRRSVGEFSRVPPLSAWQDGSKDKACTFGQRSEVKKKKNNKKMLLSSQQVSRAHRPPSPSAGQDGRKVSYQGPQQQSHKKHHMLWWICRLGITGIKKRELNSVVG